MAGGDLGLLYMDTSWFDPTRGRPHDPGGLDRHPMSEGIRLTQLNRDQGRSGAV